MKSKTPSAPAAPEFAEYIAGREIVPVDLDSVVLDPANARLHGPDSIRVVKDSLELFGQTEAIGIQAGTRKVIWGNGRVTAMRELGWTRCGAIVLDVDNTTATAMSIAMNRTAERSTWDDDVLAANLKALDEDAFDVSKLGWEADDLASILGDFPEPESDPPMEPEPARRSLADRFGVPPFSVLDARQGYWQERKRAWIASGVAESLGESAGRESKLLGGSAVDGSWQRAHGIKGCHQKSNGTSVFDPVVCELAYRWFCPTGGRILDPFAGGSVRGIVAAKLGYRYTGVELRPEQIAANLANWEDVTGKSLAEFVPVKVSAASARQRFHDGGGGDIQAMMPAANYRKLIENDEIKHGATSGPSPLAADPLPACEPPVWIEGDSRNIRNMGVGACDFVFSCPPYGDLERYSDDPNDLSTMKHEAFIEAYREIVKASVACLHPNRFACFVVGDFRDGRGFYRNFVSDTIAAFEDAGARLYNEAILITQAGSLAIRVGKQFAGYRKLGKTHQNVLVFYNGDPRRIKDEFGDVEFGESILGGEESGPLVHVDDLVGGLVDERPDL